MYTTINSVQAIFIGLNILFFGYIAYKFIAVKNSTYRLFGYGMVLIALVELCILGVSMLWTIPLANFKTLEYLFYTYAILVLFAVSASLLKNKTKYFLNIFLIFFALIVTGFFLVSPNLNNAASYSLNYYLSFDNPATVNIFSLALALSFGMAVLVVSRDMKEKALKYSVEGGFLVVIACLVIKLIAYSDTLRLVVNILQVLVLLGVSIVISSRKLNTNKK